MENDERFKHIGKDPRFRRIPKSEHKVKIDKRFQAMFNDQKFKLKYTVDKRGRPANFSTSDNLRKFYDIDSGSEDSGEEEEQAEIPQEETEQPEQSRKKTLKNGAETTPKSLEKAKKEKRTSAAGKWTVTEASEIPVQEKFTKERTKISQDTKKLLKPATNVKKSHISKEVDESEEDEEEEAEKEESESCETDDESKPTQTISDKLQDLQVDYARGDGRLVSDSSSDEETSSVDDEEEDVDHHWGELDRDAERTDESTARIAVCHMDWDRIKAVDLFVLFQSFAPPGGSINSVQIYPSEYGLKRLQEEEVHGPPELTKTSLNEDVDDQEQDEFMHMERLRQYQLSRLKYYYAVVVCNSVETAARIYDECDRMEFESSAARLDLRFIPDDMTFDQEPKDACTSMPDPTQYKPRYFMTSALQQAAVELTWDETDPDRKSALEKLFAAPKKGKGAADAMKEDDLKAFLATSSSEEEDEETQEDEGVGTDDNAVPGDEKSQIEKYRSLLANLEEQDPKKKKKSDGDMEMEITWGVGLKEKAEEIVQRKLAGVDKLTPWEERLQKRKEKHRLKKLQKKEQQKGGSDEEEEEEEKDDEEEDIPSDIDLNDPYFREELENPEFKPKKKIDKDNKSGQNKKVNRREQLSEDEEDEKKRAEMELLLMDDEDGNKKHFSLKKLVETDKKGKKKKNKDEKASNEKGDNFEVEVKDPRFGALFTSHHYNVDPSDSHFKKTKGMDKILSEKQKRRAEEPLDEPASKNPKTQTELDRLVNSIKRGVKMRNKK